MELLPEAGASGSACDRSILDDDSARGLDVAMSSSLTAGPSSVRPGKIFPAPGGKNGELDPPTAVAPIDGEGPITGERETLLEGKRVATGSSLLEIV